MKTQDRTIRDIKIGDVVTLSGKVVEIMESQGRTVSCVLFEHKTEKQTNFIKYWFNNILLKQPEKQEIEIAEDKQNVVDIIEDVRNNSLYQFEKIYKSSSFMSKYQHNNIVNKICDDILNKLCVDKKLDVSHEVTADMADFNDVVYNRDCIIELQKVVNKLLEK